MSSPSAIAIAEIKCPNSLEAMRVHLGFLVVGLGVVRAVDWEKTDGVVEVGLDRESYQQFNQAAETLIKKLTSTALCKMRISEGTLFLVVWLMDFSWAALLEKASISSRRDWTN
jgi:alanine-alpha-ketoisovalerate/valine-pyruvate aminotransferase